MHRQSSHCAAHICNSSLHTRPYYQIIKRMSSRDCWSTHCLLNLHFTRSLVGLVEIIHFKLLQCAYHAVDLYEAIILALAIYSSKPNTDTNFLLWWQLVEDSLCLSAIHNNNNNPPHSDISTHELAFNSHRSLPD